MPTGMPSATRVCSAVLRLRPSRRVSAPAARQTMHQQLLGPPRASNRFSRSAQLSELTGRNSKRGSAMVCDAAQQQRAPLGVVGFEVEMALEDEAAPRVGVEDRVRLLDQQAAQERTAARTQG